jgi:hypothetical protein
VAQLLVHVLKQCGDDLTRENVLRQATNIRQLQLGIMLPGITINTSPDDYRPIKQMRLSRFDVVSDSSRSAKPYQTTLRGHRSYVRLARVRGQSRLGGSFADINRSSRKVRLDPVRGRCGAGWSGSVSGSTSVQLTAYGLRGPSVPQRVIIGDGRPRRAPFTGRLAHNIALKIEMEVRAAIFIRSYVSHTDLFFKNHYNRKGRIRASTRFTPTEFASRPMRP